MTTVVDQCYEAPVSLQSNFARQWAFELSVAASMGLITTETPEGTFGRQWRVTAQGAAWIWS